MNRDEFTARTKAFGVRAFHLAEALPNSRGADILARQLLRAGFSVGANYRAACRARSKAEFTAKLGIVEEEADESLYWMELIVETRLMPTRRVADLHREGAEILRMVVASIKTARGWSR